MVWEVVVWVVVGWALVVCVVVALPEVGSVEVTTCSADSAWMVNSLVAGTGAVDVVVAATARDWANGEPPAGSEPAKSHNWLSDSKIVTPKPTVTANRKPASLTANNLETPWLLLKG